MRVFVCGWHFLPYGILKTYLCLAHNVRIAVLVNIYLCVRFWGEHSLMNVSMGDPLFVHADVVVLWTHIIIPHLSSMYLLHM